MKKFTYSVLKFSTAFIFISIILLIIASRLHRFQPSEMYFHEDFQNINKSEFQVLALGNSKLLSSIDKKTFERKSGNDLGMFGYSSANISISKLILESYLNGHSSTPKLVLLEVSWFTFNNKRTNLHPFVGDLFIRDFKLWKNYNKYNHREISSKILSAVLTSFTNPFKNITEISYSERFKESSPFKKSYNFNLDEFENLFPNHQAGIDQKLLNDFMDLVQLCKQNNIPIVMFTAPEDSEYVSFQKDRVKIKAIFNDLSNNNPNIYYLDYTPGSNLWDLKYENWLKDSHHINEKNLFTEVILKDIQNIFKFTDF